MKEFSIITKSIFWVLFIAVFVIMAKACDSCYNDVVNEIKNVKLVK